jgi:hypothetical protein
MSGEVVEILKRSYRNTSKLCSSNKDLGYRQHGHWTSSGKAILYDGNSVKAESAPRVMPGLQGAVYKVN